VGSTGEERETGDARESWGRGGTGMRESAGPTRPGETEGPARTTVAGADGDADDGSGAPPPSDWTGAS
jgi:hypothetical protein